MSTNKKRKVSGEKPQRFPGEVDDVHPLPFITTPPQPKEKKPGQLSEKQLKQYFDEVSTPSYFKLHKQFLHCIPVKILYPF